MQAEGADTIRERAVGPTRALWHRALVVRGTSGGCGSLSEKMESAAARDGLPYAPLLKAHSLESPAPAL